MKEGNTAFQLKNLIPSSKHDAGSIMGWACFAASGPGWLTIINREMNSEFYQGIMSVCKLNFERNVPMHATFIMVTHK